MDDLVARTVLEDLVGRIDPEQLADRAAALYVSLPAYTAFVTSADAGPDRGRQAILTVLALARPLLLDGRPPTGDERRQLVELVRVRAAEGMPMEEGLQVYRAGARIVWQSLVDVADDRERLALVELVGRLLTFIDHISAIFAEVYADESDAPRTTVERRSRDLLEALGTRPRALTVADHERAARLRFTVADAYEPFAATLTGASARRHGELAARLRSAGALAVTEGRRVVGVAPRPLTWQASEPDLLVLVDTTVTPDELTGVLDDLRRGLDLAARADRRGVVRAGDLAPELMVTAPGRAAARLEDLVVRPLLAAGQDRLLQTLAALVHHDFDRAATSRALHLHRNSLAYRARRIEELTGLDLATQRGRGLAWLALMGR